MEENGFVVLTKVRIIKFVKKIIYIYIFYLKCEGTKSATITAAERISPLYDSIYGKMWEVQVKDQTKNQTRYDLTDTNGPQDFHTDATYLKESNG